MTQIHPTAIVDPKAQHRRHRFGRALHRHRPACDASAPARPSAPHCVIEGHTTIGRDNRIFQFASLGAIPQDKKYAGEPCELLIGDRNTIREFVHLQHRLAGRRRRDPHRRRLLDHGLHPHRARLPGRQPCHPGQQHHARRPRGAGRLGDGGRPDRDPPVRQGGRAGHGGLCQRRVAGCAAVHAGGRQSAGGARLQPGRPAPARVQRGAHRRGQADAQAALPRGPHAGAGARRHRGARRRKRPKRRRTSR